MTPTPTRVTEEELAKCQDKSDALLSAAQKVADAFSREYESRDKAEPINLDTLIADLTIAGRLMSRLIASHRALEKRAQRLVADECETRVHIATLDAIIGELGLHGIGQDPVDAVRALKSRTARQEG